MRKFSGLRKSIGCVLLSASVFACTGTDAGAPVKTGKTTDTGVVVRPHSAPLAKIPTSAETLAATGAATWEIYSGKLTDPAVRQEYVVVARSAKGHVLHTVKVQTLSNVSSAKLTSTAGSSVSRIVVDSTGHVLESTLDAEKLAFHARLAHDVSQAKTEEYGCIGDIFWALGGFIVSIPTCAAIVPSIAVAPITPAAIQLCVGTVLGGPVAGGISVIEDCGQGPIDTDWDPSLGGMILVMDEPYTGDADWWDDGSGGLGGDDGGDGGDGGGDDGWGY